MRRWAISWFKAMLAMLMTVKQSYVSLVHAVENVLHGCEKVLAQDVRQSALATVHVPCEVFCARI
jgi:hypothetical protein